MYLLNYVHKLTTGDGENGVAVEVRRIWDDTLVATVVSEGSEVDGRATYSQNGSAGRVYLKMSSGGQTRRVYGDVSLQRYGGWSDADLFELWKLFGDGVMDGVGLACVVGAPSVAGRAVSVETGMVLGKGQVYVQRAKTDIAVAANASGSTRIDSVVVRFTLTGSTKWASTIVVKTGDVTITNTAAIFEIQLATISVANSVSVLTGTDISDKRYLAGVQGYVWRMPVARTAGDIFYVGSDGKVARLAAGTPGQVMRINGGVPTWDTFTADDIDGAVSMSEFGYLSNVTSDLQTQLNNKQPLDPDLTLLALKVIPVGALVGDTDAQTLTNKSLLSPAITTPTGITKADVGLGNVTNTSDASKPVSTATQAALDAKQPLDSDLTTIAASITAAGHALLDDANAAAQRTTLGLGNVDNTADASKPISAATQTALDGKQPLDPDLTAFAAKTAPTGAVVGTTDTQTLTNKTLPSPTITTPTGIVKGDVGLGNVDNTSDMSKPVSTATASALALKATAGSALTESAEASSTTTAGGTSSPPGTAGRRYDFFTLPTTSLWYVITGIEWKNGVVAAGMVWSGVDYVNGDPPVSDDIVRAAIGAPRPMSEVGTNTVQKVTRISSNPIRGGTTLGVWIATDSATAEFGQTSGTAEPNRKSLPAGQTPNADNSAWVTSAAQYYVKAYYRGIS